LGLFGAINYGLKLGGIMNWDFWIALYGAVVATIVALLEVIKYIRSRPGLKVTVGKTAMGIEAISIGWMFISVVNTGDEPISIHKAGLEIGTIRKHSSKSVAIPNPNYVITKGQSPYEIQINLEDKDIRPILQAWVIDATGKKYRSKLHPYLEPG
jgi:hypothetical protein